jgi:hypothetical protein
MMMRRPTTEENLRRSSPARFLLGIHEFAFYIRSRPWMQR